MPPAASSAWYATDVWPSAEIVMDPVAAAMTCWPTCAPEVWTTIRCTGAPPGAATKLTVADDRIQPPVPGDGDTLATVVGGCGGGTWTSNSRLLETTKNAVLPLTAPTLATVPGTWSQLEITAFGSLSENTCSGKRALTL